MANLQLQVFNNMMIKLGIPKNDRLVKKAYEIQELTKAKSDIIKHINDNARVILCLHISCELLSIEVLSLNELIKHASMSKDQYTKSKKVYMKILDLNKKTTIDELIRKLELSQKVEKTAKKIFNVYMEQWNNETTDVDASIYAMCVFFACKSENIKVVKRKILSLSNLTQGQWTQQEKQWEKWIPAVVAQKSLNNENKNSQIDSRDKEEDFSITTHHQMSKESNETEESYEAWKKKILEEAYKDLKSIK